MRELQKRKLYKSLDSLVLYGHFAIDKLVTKDGSGLPFINWPDGRACCIANLYMLALRDRPGRNGTQGLSRRGEGGGTIGEYASKISPLIRYAHKTNTDFSYFNDGHFSEFIREMRAEGSSENPNVRARSEATLLEIGRVCIDFLQFVGRLHGDPQFVAPGGTIRVEEKQQITTGRNGQAVKNIYLHHHSLPVTGRRKHSRNPITEEDIQKLRNSVNSISSSRNVQLRRNLMLSLYEHTGARRGEIGELRVEDVKNALRLKKPMLRMITLKNGMQEERYIPISRAVLTEANKYIQMARAKSMRKYGRKDHGFLFVQELTGIPLRSETFSKEIGLLRKHADIEHQVCGHMFRHAFITNLFVLLIKRHRFKNQDDFRNAFLNTAHFMADVMMWTGHRSAASVERYINLAFARLDGYEETSSTVHIIRVNRTYDRAEEALLKQLQDGLDAAEYVMRLQELKRQRKADLLDEAKSGTEALKAIQETYLEDE